MSLFGKTLCAIAVTVLGAQATAAPFGATSTYGSLAAFDNATNNATLETFDHLVGLQTSLVFGDTLDSTTLINGVTPMKGGVLYSTTVLTNEGRGLAIAKDTSGISFSGGFLTRGDEERGGLTVEFFSPGVRFFGFEANSLVGVMSLEVLSATDVDTLTVTPIHGSRPDFFGFEFNQDITQLFFQGDGITSFAIDNFTFASEAAAANGVPEPDALVLMAIALGGLSWSRRKTGR